MKVHSKLCLIDRKEKNAIVRYAYVGTGNFNEGTALIYSDHGLLTSNPNITEELGQVFSFLENNLRPGQYKHILVSPNFMRSNFITMINKEITNAKAGKPAYIVLKLNSLVDTEMINKLYDASHAGVKIFLIIRSICSLKAGVKGLSENIQAISIVDKYLEHSRIFLFCNGGKEKLYIGSGDWMTRNLDYRVEVDCPIYDEEIKKTLKTFLGVQMCDNTKSRILDPEQKNNYKKDDAHLLRAQDAFYQILQAELGHSAVHLDVKMPETLLHVPEEKVKKKLKAVKVK
jgi:polyphosphate kinase